MEQIRFGLEDGLDVSVYADPEFDFEQMREIRIGLEQKHPIPRVCVSDEESERIKLCSEVIQLLEQIN